MAELTEVLGRESNPVICRLSVISHSSDFMSRITAVQHSLDGDRASLTPPLRH